MIITDVKASHADLSDEYSKVPLEMKAAAKVMGHEVLSEATLDELFDHVKEIREQCGDRAFLRAYHFLNETQRAHDEAEALKNKILKHSFSLLENLEDPVGCIYRIFL